MLNRTLMLFALIPGIAFGAVDYTLVPRILPKLVKVEASLPDGRLAVGSGVMVAKETIATNCHVTRGAKNVRIWNGGAKWSASQQNASLEHDICILFVPGAPEYLIFPMSSTPPRIGDQVFGAGHSGGFDLRVGIGEVIALHDYDGAQVIQTNSIFDSGASGGGLFNEQGELIGIVTFRHGGNSKGGYHFSLPIEWVRSNLDRTQAKDLSSPPEGRVFWEGPPASQPYFLRAVAFEAQNKWQQLDTLAQSWSKAEPNNSGAWLALGQANRELQHYDPAIEAYRRAIALDAENSKAWFDLGLTYAASGKQDGLLEAHARLVQLDPARAEELLKLAGSARTN